MLEHATSEVKQGMLEDLQPAVGSRQRAIDWHECATALFSLKITFFKLVFVYPLPKPLITFYGLVGLAKFTQQIKA